MAKVYTEGGIRALVGKLGDSIFYVRNGVTLVRKMPAAVDNPQTASQQEIRNYLASLRETYDAYTDAQRALWEEWVGTLPEPPDDMTGSPNFFKFPYRGISGFNGFASVNLRLLRSGYTLVSTPPGTVLPGPDTVSAEWDEGDDEINVVFTWDGTLPAGTLCRIILKGQGNWKGNPIRIIEVSDELTVSGAGDLNKGFPVQNWKVGHGKFIEEVSIAENLRGKRFIFQGLLVVDDGRRSVPSDLVNEVVPFV